MHTFKIFLLFILLSSCLFNFLQAQDDANQQKVEKYMEEAKRQIKDKDYESANITFRQLLATKAVLPTEMSYLFAETLFMIKQFQNSYNFLEKYFKLTGESGEYYHQAFELKELLVVKLAEIKDCNYCNDQGYREEHCDKCEGSGIVVQSCTYCKAEGIVACAVCNGEGVLITKNKFQENEYQSCKNCTSKGVVKCPRCKGTKQIEDNCYICNGVGKRSTTVVCDHKKAVIEKLEN